jgi:hypothetical protein
MPVFEPGRLRGDAASDLLRRIGHAGRQPRMRGNSEPARETLAELSDDEIAAMEASLPVVGSEKPRDEDA